MDWKDRIVKDPRILAGKPTVKGTRISVAPASTAALSTSRGASTSGR